MRFFFNFAMIILFAKYGLCYYVGSNPKQKNHYRLHSIISSSKEDLSNIILYDGFCNFCNKWVDFLITIDKEKIFKFSALQSDNGKDLLQRIGKQKDDISSVVYIKSLSNDLSVSKIYTKSDAALKVMETLGLSPLAAASVLPVSLRDSLYDVVAFNRYNFLGKRSECRCGDEKNKDRFL